MPTIGDIGDHIDVVIRQGTSFGPHRVEMRNADDTPVDLTGAIVQGRVFTDRVAVPSITVELIVELIDPINGIFEFGLTPEKTASLPAGRDMRDKNGAHEWCMEIVYLDGFVQPLFWGDAQVKSSGS